VGCCHVCQTNFGAPTIIGNVASFGNGAVYITDLDGCGFQPYTPNSSCGFGIGLVPGCEYTIRVAMAGVTSMDIPGVIIGPVGSQVQFFDQAESVGGGTFTQAGSNPITVTSQLANTGFTVTLKPDTNFVKVKALTPTVSLQLCAVVYSSSSAGGTCEGVGDPTPPGPLSATCLPATNVGPHSITFNGAGQNVPVTDHIRIQIGTTPGGPYVDFTDFGAGNNTPNQPVSTTRTMFGPLPIADGTTYYYRTVVMSGANAVLAASPECQVTTPIDPDVILFTYNDGASPAQIAQFENMRTLLNNGFITPPALFNGDRHVHIGINVNQPLGPGVLGIGGPSTFRPDNTTYEGFVFTAGSQPDGVIIHEVLHALGMVTGDPNWDAFIVNPATVNAGFTGPQALAEYHAMAGGFPASPVIPVSQSNDHWYSTFCDGAAGGSAYGQNCMIHDVLTSCNGGLSDQMCFSRVDAAMLRDLGYDYNINNGVALACGGSC